MTDSVQQMKDMVLEVLDKYTFIEEYVNKPNVLTGNKIPIFKQDYLGHLRSLRRFRSKKPLRLRALGVG